eukprot:TRINITY_DN2806_c0_g1_i2.p1 TRINITY_DN2806_c0_g1~~TRINITY_DN2806_c0_g1_i2.p1  ORF type:complete len:309 (+),score=35.79 TRINITY_DN2806_c0_g1_i2:119-1045(+)
MAKPRETTARKFRLLPMFAIALLMIHIPCYQSHEEQEPRFAGEVRSTKLDKNENPREFTPIETVLEIQPGDAEDGLNSEPGSQTTAMMQPSAQITTERPVNTFVREEDEALQMENEPHACPEVRRFDVQQQNQPELTPDLGVRIRHSRSSCLDDTRERQRSIHCLGESSTNSAGVGEAVAEAKVQPLPATQNESDFLEQQSTWSTWMLGVLSPLLLDAVAGDIALSELSAVSLFLSFAFYLTIKQITVSRSSNRRREIVVRILACLAFGFFLLALFSFLPWSGRTPQFVGSILALLFGLVWYFNTWDR